MLAGLVLASFTVTPERRAPLVVAPNDDRATEARIRPLSRGLVRGLRDFDEPEPSASPSPTPAPSDSAAVDAAGAPAVEATVEPEPEAMPDPTSEPTPEPTAPPAPRPAARPNVAITNPTTLWAEG